MTRNTDELALELLEKARRAADRDLSILDSLEAACQAVEAGGDFADAVVEKWVGKVLPAGSALSSLLNRMAQPPVEKVGKVYGFGLALAAHIENFESSK